MLAAGEFTPDVIVLDLYMPVMDGRQFHAALRTDPKWAKVQVILCTGSTPLVSAWLDIFQQLQKPIDLDSLLSVVERGCAVREPPPGQALSA
jgi:CheY-like chemotaxis protein